MWLKWSIVRKQTERSATPFWCLPNLEACEGVLFQDEWKQIYMLSFIQIGHNL